MYVAVYMHILNVTELTDGDVLAMVPPPRIMQARSHHRYRRLRFLPSD